MKGFLTFLVLKLISNRDMSGDEIREELKKRKGTMPSPGTIYPVLKELSSNGFIEEVSKNKKEKKYRLTKSGKRELEAAIKKFCMLFHDLKDEFKRCGC